MRRRPERLTSLAWKADAPLLELIFANHDVTKHRQQAGVTGMGRVDPPTGFYDSLGIPDDPISHGMYGPSHPMQEVRIPKHPKLPISQAPKERAAWTSLEELEKTFYALITKSFQLALEDARRTIILKDPTLHT